MKIRKLFFVAIVWLSFVSCDAIKDWTAIEVDTEINVEAPLEATDDASSFVMKSSLAVGDFGGSVEYDLKKKKDYDWDEAVGDLRSIHTDNVLFSLTGLSGDEKINTITITIKVGDNSQSQTFKGITSGSSESSVGAFIELINSWDVTEISKVEFTVTGNANFHVTKDVKANIRIPAKVKASPLK